MLTVRMSTLPMDMGVQQGGRFKTAGKAGTQQAEPGTPLGVCREFQYRMNCQFTQTTRIEVQMHYRSALRCAYDSASSYSGSTPSQPLRSVRQQYSIFFGDHDSRKQCMQL